MVIKSYLTGGSYGEGLASLLRAIELCTYKRRIVLYILKTPRSG